MPPAMFSIARSLGAVAELLELHAAAGRSLPADWIDQIAPTLRDAADWAAGIEAEAASASLIAHARQGEIGPARPAIESTALGYQALGVGPKQGEVVDFARVLQRERLASEQRRLQEALDAGDEDEVMRLAALPHDAGGVVEHVLFGPEMAAATDPQAGEVVPFLGVRYERHDGDGDAA